MPNLRMETDPVPEGLFFRILDEVQNPSYLELYTPS
jgi:hypothetical protein